MASCPVCLFIYLFLSSQEKSFPAHIGVFVLFFILLDSPWMPKKWKILTIFSRIPPLQPISFLFKLLVPNPPEANFMRRPCGLLEPLCHLPIRVHKSLGYRKIIVSSSHLGTQSQQLKESRQHHVQCGKVFWSPGKGSILQRAAIEVLLSPQPDQLI